MSAEWLQSQLTGSHLDLNYNYNFNLNPNP